jgi:hypothetical protein
MGGGVRKEADHGRQEKKWILRIGDIEIKRGPYVMPHDRRGLDGRV